MEGRPCLSTSGEMKKKKKKEKTFSPYHTIGIRDSSILFQAKLAYKVSGGGGLEVVCVGSESWAVQTDRETSKRYINVTRVSRVCVCAVSFITFRTLFNSISLTFEKHLGLFGFKFCGSI